PNAQAPGCNTSYLTIGDARMAQDLGLPVPLLTWFYRAVSWIARLSMAFIGLLLFWRRPDDWVAWLLSLALSSSLLEGVVNLGGWQIVVDICFAIGSLAWLPLLFIFPNGRVEPRWMRGVLAALTPVMAGSAWLIQYPGRLPAFWSWLNIAVILVCWIGLGGYALVYRYRRVSNAVERQQTKWVIVGFFMVFVTSTIYLFMTTLYPPWQPSPARLAGLTVNGVTYALGYAGFAACLGISILRYRLWDIDLIIRRTLLYSALTLTLGLTYLGGVVVLQQLFGRLMGGGGGSAAIVATTLLIAALFQPLRRRLQNLIDRRFYRRKYDTAQTLAAFAATARDNMDLDELTGRLQDVLDETMQPAHSAVWLNEKPAAP
ncbi:MAG: hypothetical protein ABI847_20610, partial [Anaerolineales bacterium]